MNSSKPGNSRPVATALVLVGYCLARSYIYRHFPVDSVGSGFARDTWMTIPRFVAFLAIFCIWAGWQTLAEDWGRSGSLQAKVVGVIVTAIWCFYYSASQGGYFSHQAIGIGTAGSLVVALFEEYAFRGPLLMDLARRTSFPLGMLVTSALFTIYHVQAEAPEFWTAIFLTGAILAGLRGMGMGLGGLVAIHTIVDSAYFFCGSHPPPMASFQGIILLIVLLVCAIKAFPPSNQRLAKFSL